jgi:hypothetical protein
VSLLIDVSAKPAAHSPRQRRVRYSLPRVYILAHENRARAKENWSKFGPDPEWKELLSKSAPTGQLKIESVFVTPTDFSPVK